VTTGIPKLSLSHGQVLWALSHGMPASQDTVDQVRYLRLLGCPLGPTICASAPAIGLATGSSI
jgi:hypothetical protein